MQRNLLIIQSSEFIINSNVQIIWMRYAKLNQKTTKAKKKNEKEEK